MIKLTQEHIFAYFLNKNCKNKICENELKNKSNYAIEKIKKIMGIKNNLANDIKNSLQTDDLNKEYNLFIEKAIKDDLIEINNNYIYKKKKLFKSPGKKNTSKKFNIIETYLTEIKKEKKIIKILNKIYYTPYFFIKRKIRKQFIKLDCRLFQEDYNEFSIKGESKPKYIGKPFFMRKIFQKKGVIVVHGYMAAPEEVKALGKYLFHHGYAVYGVRLRGHGTAPEDLALRGWEEWYESVNRAYIVLKNYCKELAIVGFSAGGCVSLYQAAKKNHKFKGVVTIDAPLKLKNIASKLVSTVVAWNSFTKMVHFNNANLEYVENRPENLHINYHRNPISGVHQLELLMNKTKKSLREIKIPAMVLQADKDPIVDPQSGLEIYNNLGSVQKELKYIKSNRHGIVNGDTSKEVFNEVKTFLDNVFKTK